MTLETPRLWPFPVDWQATLSVEHEAKTAIKTSRNGKEQRSAVRQEPRKALEFSISAHGDARRTLMRLTDAYLGHPWIVADESRSFSYPNGLGAGATALTPPEVTSWMVAGRPLVIDRAGVRARVTIDSVAGGNLNLGAVQAAMPPGTKVFCAYYARLEDFSITEETDNVTTASVRFNAEPGAEANPFEGSGEAGDLFNGREVFALTPNWSTRPRIDVSFLAERMDHGRGVSAVIYPVAFGSRQRQANFMARTRADAEALREFFWRMQGRRGEFYAPTGSHDLPMKAAVLSGGNTFRVAGTEVATAYGASTVFKAVQVRLKNGTVLNRKITTLAANAGDSLFTLDGTWGIAIAPADVRSISWLPVWRLASDSFTIEWLTDSVAQAQLTMTTLEDRAGT